MREKGGIAYCLDAKNGEVAYQQRLTPEPGIIYSSPVVADGKIYIVSQHNGTYVLAAQPKYQLIAHNDLGDDSRANASPAISDGRLFLRTDEALYCIGSK